MQPYVPLLLPELKVRLLLFYVMGRLPPYTWQHN